MSHILKLACRYEDDTLVDKTEVRRFYKPDGSFACTSKTVFSVDFLEQMTEFIVTCAPQIVNLVRSYNAYNKIEESQKLIRRKFSKFVVHYSYISVDSLLFCSKCILLLPHCYEVAQLSPCSSTSQRQTRQYWSLLYSGIKVNISSLSQ